MSIPKQVEEAAKMAEELMASQMQTDDIEEPQEELEQEEEEAEAQPEEEPETEEEVEPEPEVPDEEDSFKQKYMSLKGKYDSEVPRLNQELKEFKEQVFSRLGDSSKKQPEVEQPVNQEPQLPQEAVEWLEEYGDDYTKGLDAYLNYKMEQQLATRLKPLESKVNVVEENEVRVAQQNFTTYLDGKVEGDWKTLWAGQDDGFKEFLQQPDPSGLYTYGDLARIYNDNWDADRLATVFNTYLGKSTVEKTPQAPKPVQEGRIAPSRRSVEPPKPDKQGQIWTRESIAEFQKKDRQGAYKPEEAQALWNDLLLAPSQNRIRD